MKNIFRCVALLALLAIEARAQSNLVVSNDGGASNITATSAYLSMNISRTNPPAILHTNFFGWTQGTNDFTNCLACWPNISTNEVAFGIAQTNLTAQPSNTKFTYRSFSKDVSNGLVSAASSLHFQTLLGSLTSNYLDGATNIVVTIGANNIGTLTVNGVSVTGGGVGGGTTNLATIMTTGGTLAGDAGGASVRNSSAATGTFDLVTFQQLGATGTAALVASAAAQTTANAASLS